MGADNSKSDQEKAREERILKLTLENQRLMFERKSEELRQAQRQILQIERNVNLNQTARNNVCEQTYNPASGAPLYPDLNNMTNNNTQMTAVYANSSTSYLQRPSIARSPVLPTAPPACLVQEPIPSQIPPRLHQSQPQQKISQSSQTFPSTSSGTAQSVFKAEKSQSNLQTRSHRSQPQHPISQSSQTFPSTSSGTPQSVFKTEKSQSNQKTRYSPQCDATLNIVKCVTCNDVLGIRIYQCKNGHSSCAECRIKNAKCGFCPERVSDMRNLALETHIADLKLKEIGEKLITCPNAANGCRLSLNTNKMENHVNKCPYREMACPLTAIIGICTWKGKLNQLMGHFKEEHQEHLGADIDKEMFLLNVDVNHKIVQLVNIGAFLFLVHFEVNKDQKTICMTVQSMSTKISASKWSYELHVYNKRQPRRKFHFIDTCFSNSETVQEIFTKKNCAVLSLDYARTFLDNGRLTYKFFIKKKF